MSEFSVTDDQASLNGLLSDVPGAPRSATKAAVREVLDGHASLGHVDLPHFTAFLRVLNENEQLRLELRDSIVATLDDEQESERKRDENLKVALKGLIESRARRDAVAYSELTNARARLQALRNVVSASAQATKATQLRIDFGAIANTPDPEDIDGVLWLIIILSLLTYQIADASLAERVQAGQDEYERIKERVRALEKFITDLLQTPAPETEMAPYTASVGATPAPDGTPPATRDLVSGDSIPTVKARRPRKLR